MQELAAKLGDRSETAATETALLDRLNSCKLEAEVVELLCVFWLASRGHRYLPHAELADSIPKPSLLSDLILADLEVAGSEADETLHVAPLNFDMTDDFERVQGVDLPRRFRTELLRLEERTKLPFLRQMAYEWAQNHVTYPEAPYQGDLSHFTRPLGDGFNSHLSARAALRAISAYLRTLAVALKFWGMPLELAGATALLAFPIHPSLALLKPNRPDWFPAHTSFEGKASAIEDGFSKPVRSRTHRASSRRFNRFQFTRRDIDGTMRGGFANSLESGFRW